METFFFIFIILFLIIGLIFNQINKRKENLSVMDNQKEFRKEQKKYFEGRQKVLYKDCKGTEFIEIKNNKKGFKPVGVCDFFSGKETFREGLSNNVPFNTNDSEYSQEIETCYLLNKSLGELNIIDGDSRDKVLSKLRQIPEMIQITGVGNEDKGCGYCYKESGVGEILYGDSLGPYKNTASPSTCATWIKPGDIKRGGGFNYKKNKWRSKDDPQKIEFGGNQGIVEDSIKLHEQEICSNVKKCDDLDGEKSICGWCYMGRTGDGRGEGMVAAVDAAGNKTGETKYMDDYCPWPGEVNPKGEITDLWTGPGDSSEWLKKITDTETVTDEMFYRRALRIKKEEKQQLTSVRYDNAMGAVQRENARKRIKDIDEEINAIKRMTNDETNFKKYKDWKEGDESIKDDTKYKKGSNDNNILLYKCKDDKNKNIKNRKVYFLKSFYDLTEEQKIVLEVLYDTHEFYKECEDNMKIMGKTVTQSQVENCNAFNSILNRVENIRLKNFFMKLDLSKQKAGCLENCNSKDADACTPYSFPDLSGAIRDDKGKGFGEKITKMFRSEPFSTEWANDAITGDGDLKSFEDLVLTWLIQASSEKEPKMEPGPPYATHPGAWPTTMETVLNPFTKRITTMPVPGPPDELNKWQAKKREWDHHQQNPPQPVVEDLVIDDDAWKDGMRKLWKLFIEHVKKNNPGAFKVDLKMPQKTVFGNSALNEKPLRAYEGGFETNELETWRDYTIPDAPASRKGTRLMLNNNECNVLEEKFPCFVNWMGRKDISRNMPGDKGYDSSKPLGHNKPCYNEMWKGETSYDFRNNTYGTPCSEESKSDFVNQMTETAFELNGVQTNLLPYTKTKWDVVDIPSTKSNIKRMREVADKSKQYSIIYDKDNRDVEEQLMNSAKLMTLACYGKETKIDDNTGQMLQSEAMPYSCSDRFRSPKDEFNFPRPEECTNYFWEKHTKNKKIIDGQGSYTWKGKDYGKLYEYENDYHVLDPDYKSYPIGNTSIQKVWGMKHLPKASFEDQIHLNLTNKGLNDKLEDMQKYITSFNGSNKTADDYDKFLYYKQLLYEEVNEKDIIWQDLKPESGTTVNADKKIDTSGKPWVKMCWGDFKDAMSLSFPPNSTNGVQVKPDGTLDILGNNQLVKIIDGPEHETLRNILGEKVTFNPDYGTVITKQMYEKDWFPFWRFLKLTDSQYGGLNGIKYYRRSEYNSNEKSQDIIVKDVKNNKAGLFRLAGDATTTNSAIL